jgi:hypothetical protein
VIARGMLALALVSAAPAMAAEKNVRYAKPGNWVLPPPAPTSGATPSGAAVRVVYSDIQTRASEQGDEVYTSWRMKLLTADALAVGNISATWNPAAGGATVHHLNIIRDGKVINVLSGTRFAVVQREANLESAALDGQLTATLQVPGLQVGDELEFAATVRSKDPTLGDHHFGFSMLSPLGNPGAYRMRLSWPSTVPIHWQASPDMGPIVPQAEGDLTSISYELRDPDASLMTEGAPARYNIRRLIEYSNFSSWKDMSAQLWPLFDQAALIGAASPLRQEIARIAAQSNDPMGRAQAALQLVQDKLRYVYVGLGGGNYRPATVDESWSRRFADCKAKTVLLMALLRELGVPAEAVLVNSNGGDGLDARLASPMMFDHVLVRARIGDQSYWLDGTRQGDRDIARQRPVPYRWVLPLRQEGAGLEAVAAGVPRQPDLVEYIDIDQRAGIDKPAKIVARNILRGDETYQLRVQLAGMTAQDADRAVQTYWRQQAGWVDVDKVGWRYDEAHAALVLTLEGTGRTEWKGSDEDGWSHYLFGAGFYAPDNRKRPRDQDQAAPYAINFPRFRCYATVLRLPRPTGDWHWNVAGKRVNRTLGGVAYWRGISLIDNVVRSVQSSHSLVPEISAAEANILNAAIPGFNTSMTRVDQDSSLQADVGRPEPMLAKGDEIDWLDDATPCDGPPPVTP